MIAFACSSRWIRPCFSRDAESILADRSRPGMSLEPTPRAYPFGLLPSGSKTMRSTPQRNTVSRCRPLISGPVFEPVLRPKIPRKPGRQALAPRPRPAGGVVGSGALVGATGGTQTHSRRTGRKLGRLRYARQGLVRVPESNTKYGGWGGITGGSAAPVMGPSIGESSGNPKRKNCPGGCGFQLRPAVHRRGIFSRSGLALAEVTYGYGSRAAGMSARRWPWGRITAK
jgi:hypothetical protein